LLQLVEVGVLLRPYYFKNSKLSSFNFLQALSSGLEILGKSWTAFSRPINLAMALFGKKYVQTSNGRKKSIIKITASWPAVMSIPKRNIDEPLVTFEQCNSFIDTFKVSHLESPD